MSSKKYLLYPFATLVGGWERGGSSLTLRSVTSKATTDFGKNEVKIYDEKRLKMADF
jgi:hypothetical protein